MDTAVLVRIHASCTAGKMKRKSGVNTLFGKLYGYNTFSNYSRYNRHRKGLLEEVPSVRYEGGLIIGQEGGFQEDHGACEGIRRGIQDLGCCSER